MLPGLLFAASMALVLGCAGVGVYALFSGNADAVVHRIRCWWWGGDFPLGPPSKHN